MPNIDPQDAIQLIRARTQHVNFVQEGLLVIAQALQRRGLVHDRSKFSADEFAGFCRINAVAREHPYGSAEYRAGLKQEKPTIELHYARNSHHPEHHDEAEAGSKGTWEDRTRVEAMGFLDIIEMVCDWRSAYLAYGSQGTWEENMDRQRERYKDWFSSGQWLLLEQVAAFIGREIQAEARP